MIELLGLHIENILSLITQHNETNSNKLQKKFLSYMMVVVGGGIGNRMYTGSPKTVSFLRK